MLSIRWTGKDAIDFVESVTTADVHGFKPMQGAYTVMPNENGGIIDDCMIAKCYSEEHGLHVYQVVNAAQAEKNLDYFGKQLTDFGGDVNMNVLRDNHGVFALQGPKAKDVMNRFCPSIDLDTIPFLQMFWTRIEGVKCLVWRCGYTGEDGFEISVSAEGAMKVWYLLRDQPEVRLGGIGARMTLGREAALCHYHEDIDDTTTPAEAGLSWVVARRRRDPKSNNKFPGFHKIVQQVKRPRKLVKRVRIGMKFLVKGPPAWAGAIIENENGEQVGAVRGGKMSPTLGEVVLVGYVDKPYNRKSAKLTLSIGDGKFPVMRVKMPFVQTHYHKA